MEQLVTTAAPTATPTPAPINATITSNPSALPETSDLPIQDIAMPDYIDGSIFSPKPTETAAVTETPAPTYATTPLPAPTPWYMQSWVWFSGIALLALVLLIVLICRLTRRSKTDAIPSTADMPTSALPPLLIGNAQHIGARDSQQDSFGMSDLTDPAVLRSRGFLAVLADGMGGLANGAQISQTVVHTLLSGFASQDASVEPSLRLLLLTQQAQAKVLQLQGSSSGGSGSTLVTVLLCGNELYTLSIGDSRILLYRNHGCIQLNRDHIYAAELDERVALGQLAYTVALHDQQRKSLTSYIGMPKPLQVDHPLQPITLLPGDKIALMSDGVYGTLSESELNQLLVSPAYQAAQDIQQAVLAKAKPHQDNLTVIVLEYNG